MGNLPLSSTESMGADDSCYGRPARQIDGRTVLARNSEDLPSPSRADATTKRRERTKQGRRQRRRYAVPLPALPRFSSPRNHRGRAARRGHTKSLLVASILARDWQKVLIRARLFPDEVHEFVAMDLPLAGGERRRPPRRARLLPLHVACALDPPPGVVRALASGGAVPRSRAPPPGVAVAAAGNPGIGGAIAGALVALRGGAPGSRAPGEGARGAGDGPCRDGGVADFVRQVEDRLAHNGRCGGGRAGAAEPKRNRGRGFRSPPHRRSPPHFVVEFDPSVFLPSLSPGPMLPKPRRSHGGGTGRRRPAIGSSGGGFRDNESSSRENGDCDEFFSPENSIGDAETAMTTSTPRLAGPFGCGGNESSSLEYLTEDSDSSASGSSNGRGSFAENGSPDKPNRAGGGDAFPATVTDDDSCGGRSGCDDDGSDDDSLSFLQLTADGGLAVLDIRDDASSSGVDGNDDDDDCGYGYGEARTGGNGCDGSGAQVSSSGSDSNNGSGAGGRSSNGSASPGVRDGRPRAATIGPEDIGLSPVALLRSLPRPHRRRGRKGPTRKRFARTRRGKASPEKPTPGREGHECGAGPSRLLPIHIACLYGASAAVLRVLLQEHPNGSSAEVLGMLPVHMAAANWSVAGEQTGVPRSGGSSHGDSNRCGGAGDRCQKDRLEALVEHAPRSLFAKSTAHGLRPLEYTRILLCDVAGDSVEGIRCSANYLAAKETESRHRESRVRNAGAAGRNNNGAGDRDRGDDGDCDDVSCPNATTGVEFEHRIDSVSTCTTSASTILHDAASPAWVSSSPTNTRHAEKQSRRDAPSLSELLCHCRWQEAVALLERHPQTAREWSDCGCGNHNNDDDENNSEGPKLAGRPPCSSPEGRCTGPPLHAACRIHGSRAETPAGTLRLPVSPNPRALRQPGPRRPGSLPLHLLCDSFSSLRFRCATTTATVSPPPPKRHDALELLRVLLASHPRATSVPDRRGRLPLHRAVLAGAPFEAVRMLVHRDPRAIALPDRDGLTPLAHAKKVYPVGGSVPKLLELAWV